jgi:nitrate reductase alpha subunit
MHWDERTIRNVKLPWAEVQKTKNPLWEAGYRFYLLTPKSRHRVHSSWSNVDWHIIWDSNHGDPFRRDKRLPFFGDHQMHVNPDDAQELGLNNGDYVYVDSNPEDRPFRGWQNDPARAKVARLMVRVTFNTSYPRGVVMIKHAPYIATEKTVHAHETRPDGRARSEDTGYQANLRYGAQQSCTRNWLMPMHQTDTLFHKAKLRMAFMFGGEADNHAVNTVPKETLVRIVKAEVGGEDGKSPWEANAAAFGPHSDKPENELYLSGGYVQIKT